MDTKFDKRIVLAHKTGIMAGVFSICGRRSEIQGELALYNPEVNMRDHKAPAALVEHRKRYVLYVEVVEPAATKTS